jgi:UDP-N-acetylglucosamine--N-acetylmuramyl-(pentapeptide) pyrophosphoryl-undecaprenol N-acetylglucosamine transferase
MKIGITGGGSAGHVVPALAVAAQLSQNGAHELVYFGRSDSIEHEYAKTSDIPFRPVPSAGLKRYGSWSNLRMPFTVLHGIGAAWKAMRRERPDVVFSSASRPGCAGFPSSFTNRTTRSASPTQSSPAWPPGSAWPSRPPPPPPAGSAGKQSSPAFRCATTSPTATRSGCAGAGASNRSPCC